MKKQARTFIVAALLLASSQCPGQYGNPFITDLPFPKKIHFENYDITQDRSGNMLFANRDGILMFNGLSWNLLDIPVLPYVFFNDSISGKIFLGCNNSFGELVLDEKDVPAYRSLSGDLGEIGEIRWIQANREHLYFYSHTCLVKVARTGNGQKEIWRAPEGTSINGLIVTGKAVFVNLLPFGLHILTPAGPEDIPVGYLLDEEMILFSLRISKDQYLVGTGRSNLFLFDGVNLLEYGIKDRDYLVQNVLAGGLLMPTGEIALSTRTGGCLIIDPASRSTNYTFNYQTGLPDDEIFCLGMDNNLGLWLMHEYGASRIDFSLPVRNYGIYPGLEGNLIAAQIHNGRLFVSTSEGLYYLREKKNYQEVEVLVPVTFTEKIDEPAPGKPSAEPGIVRDPRETGPERTVQEPESVARPGLLQRLFGRKKASGEAAEAYEETPPADTRETVRLVSPARKEPSAPRTVQRTRYVRRKVNALQSISYVFSRVEGLYGKCRHILSADDRLLAATNVGLFEIIDNTARPLILDKNINRIEPSGQKDLYFAGSSEGVILLHHDGTQWAITPWAQPAQEIFSLWYDRSSNILWTGAEKRIIRFELDSFLNPVDQSSHSFEEMSPHPVLVREINNAPFFFSGGGIYTYDTRTDSIIPASDRFAYTPGRSEYITCQAGYTWNRIDDSWDLLNPVNWKPAQADYLRLFTDIGSIFIDQDSNLWIVHERKNLSKIVSGWTEARQQKFTLFYTGLTDAQGILNTDRKLELTYDQFPVEFSCIAPFYVNSDQTEYQYLFDPIMEDWSRWDTRFKQVPLHNPEPGSITLYIRARNILGDVSNVIAVEFFIRPPVYRTWYFLAAMVLIAVLLVFFIIRLRTRKLQKDKNLLEIRVMERTREINEQKEEISSQRDEIEKQRDRIMGINKEITESITYASRIQAAILPPEEKLKKLLPDHFILFKPRDIVSGDFYWARERNGQVIVAAGDCTGHGVPGAFMSMLAVSALNEIAGNESVRHACDILNTLRNKVIDSLHQTGCEDEGQEGVDIALCIIDPRDQYLEFSGAFNPLYHFREGKLTVVKADKMPIGIFDRGKKSFTNHRMKIRKGDMIYIFSDGFIDQFGGETGGKFKSSNFTGLLHKLQDVPVPEQSSLLEKAFSEWKGNFEQVDDILIFGIRI